MFGILNELILDIIPKGEYPQFYKKAGSYFGEILSKIGTVEKLKETIPTPKELDYFEIQSIVAFVKRIKEDITDAEKIFGQKNDI